MSAELIYKTSTPAAIDWWHTIEQKREAAHLVRRDYAKRATELFGVTPKSYGEPNTAREIMVSGPRVVGLASGYHEDPPKGSGWRLDSKDHYWKPALRTEEGKARAAELAGLFSVDARKESRRIGVPADVWGNRHVYWPGFEFDAEQSVLYVIWSGFTAQKEVLVAQAEHPEIDWVEVPRSVWYAREEAKAVRA